MSLLATLNFENNSRYELKYRLSYQQYLRVKNALWPYVKYDPYTDASPIKKYFVRSLYFDSPDYRLYNEKLGGDHSRIKFRIRTYSKESLPESVIRVELKVRQGEKSKKYSAFAPALELCNFMRHYHWDCASDPVLIEFERHVHASILRPKVLVQYEREGFQSNCKDDVRITFDHRVSSGLAKELFPKSAFFRQHYPHEVILEIKHQTKIPNWIKEIVQAYSLKIETNSKYCQGIEVTQMDMVNHALRL